MNTSTPAISLMPIELGLISLGVPLELDLFDKAGCLLLGKGHVIDTDFQLYLLMKRGVYIECTEEEKERRLGHTKKPSNFFNPILKCEELEKQLSRALRSTSNETFELQINELRTSLEELAAQHFDAAFASLLLNDGKHYPITHQLQTALVVARLSQKLPELSTAERSSFIKASLTMNIGMLGLQTMLLSQTTPLTETQRHAIEQHPLESVTKLISLGVSDETWLRSVLEHHETSSGTGYPEQISDVCLGAQLVSLADIFCAKISEREYRKGMPPPEAAKQLFSKEGQQNAGSLASLLIKEIGIYPAGCFVKLVNGEQALVIRRGRTALKPLVASLAGADGVPYAHPIIRETASTTYAIAEAISRDAIQFDIDPSSLWSARA